MPPPGLEQLHSLRLSAVWLLLTAIYTVIDVIQGRGAFSYLSRWTISPTGLSHPLEMEIGPQQPSNLAAPLLICYICLSRAW